MHDGCPQVIQQDEGVSEVEVPYLSLRLIMINCGSECEIKFEKRMINGDMNVNHSIQRLAPAHCTLGGQKKDRVLAA